MAELFRILKNHTLCDSLRPVDFTAKCHTLLTNYLVEKGDYFMAFFEGMSGYAVDTIMSALHNTKCVFIINPDDI